MSQNYESLTRSGENSEYQIQQQRHRFNQASPSAAIRMQAAESGLLAARLEGSG